VHYDHEDRELMIKNRVGVGARGRLGNAGSYDSRTRSGSRRGNSIFENRRGGSIFRKAGGVGSGGSSGTSNTRSLDSIRSRYSTGSVSDKSRTPGRFFKSRRESEETHTASAGVGYGASTSFKNMKPTLFDKTSFSKTNFFLTGKIWKINDCLRYLAYRPVSPSFEGVDIITMTAVDSDGEGTSFDMHVQVQIERDNYQEIGPLIFTQQDLRPYPETTEFPIVLR
jgi:hypothetical protein